MLGALFSVNQSCDADCGLSIAGLTPVDWVLDCRGRLLAAPGCPCGRREAPNLATGPTQRRWPTQMAACHPTPPGAPGRPHIEDADVTLTARCNDATHSFGGPGVDCRGKTSTCELTMDAARAVTALSADRCAEPTGADRIRAVAWRRWAAKLRIRTRPRPTTAAIRSDPAGWSPVPQPRTPQLSARERLSPLS